MPDTTVTVVGGGIVGCAVAAELSRVCDSVVLLEREDGLARGTTSRNSEVSHGGMYYPAGSLKARLCVRGRRLLKEFCTAAGVGYRECGKLIVAAGEKEIPELERLLALGRENGVEDLRLVDQAELARLEPQIRGVAALYSPRTGILDAEGAARAYAAQAAEQGARIMTGALATGLARETDRWRVQVSPEGAGRREGWEHTSVLVVNAAGLWADRVAALAGIDPVAAGWEIVPSKGNYFTIDPRHAGRIERLVYPVPPSDGSFLGVHVCLDLAGRMRLGPDYELVAPPVVEECDRLDPFAAGWDYRVDLARGDEFFRGASSFLPWLEREDLSPDMSGVRPKLAAAGFRDFVVEAGRGDLAGLIQLVGIDSPGLTSAPALAREVAAMAREILA